MSTQFHVTRFFPFLGAAFLALPVSVSEAMFPQYAAMTGLFRTLIKHATFASQNPKSDADHKTTFDALSDPKIPPSERDVRRLTDEGFVLFSAGTVTTSRALAIACFHIYSQKHVLLRLRQELLQVMPHLDSRPSWAELVSLPYMVRWMISRRLVDRQADHASYAVQNAVVHETLRVFHGTINRQARCAPTEALRYQDFVIPPGVSQQIILQTTYGYTIDIFSEADPSQHLFLLHAHGCQNLSGTASLSARALDRGQANRISLAQVSALVRERC